MAKKTIKKQKAKKSTLRFLVFGVASIIISGTVALSISKLWSEIYQKYKEKKDLDQKLVELKSQEKELKVDVEKMQDPEYIARYLREKYLYSKDGEYIIRIPEK
ncbi:MAG: septum formation initiator family protein [Clostridium sp.]|nr:septum formation initiator family protein [Clostridium sp.]